MVKSNQNDTFYALNKRTLRFTVTNEDVTPAVALDLTSYTIRWAMSKILPDGSYSDTASLKKISTTSGDMTLTQVEDGIVDVEIDKDDIPNPGGKFHQELEILDASENPVVVAVGTLTILKNVKNT